MNTERIDHFGFFHASILYFHKNRELISIPTPFTVYQLIRLYPNGDNNDNYDVCMGDWRATF